MIARLWCALIRRHKDAMVERGNTELYLRCPDCGARTAGWPMEGSNETLSTQPIHEDDRGERNPLGFDRPL